MAYSHPFPKSTITSPFGATSGRPNAHRGTDYAPGGPPVPAIERGTVVRSEYQSGLGNVVVLRHPDGYYSGYSHLASRAVNVGQGVGKGQHIGVVGNTGTLSQGRHLHLTISPTSNNPATGVVIDPVKFIDSNGGGGGSTAGGGGSAVGLGFGLSSAAQKAVQAALTKLGRYDGPVDGEFGTKSVAGFQQYLKDVGLLPGDYGVDGVPGTNYGKAIQALAAKHGYTGPIDGDPGEATSQAIIAWANSVVGSGSGGGGGAPSGPGWGLSTAAQKAAQEALTKNGLYNGPVDGEFGEASVKAMQQLLKNLGILPGDYAVDGVPGENYGKALQTLAARYGYTGPIDGAPGEATSEGIIAWAKASIGGGTPPVVTPPVTPPTGQKWPTTGSFGIDVATTQRDINFNSAKADGTKWVIVKMGGLNVTPQYVAPYYAKQIDGARAAGLPVGHYYLIGKGQTPEAQAEYFVKNLYKFDVKKDVLALDNEKLDDNGTFWTQDDAAKFLAKVISLTGIDPKRVWHYAGAADYRGHKPWDKVNALGVRFWWAAYGDNDGTRDHEPSLQGSIPEATVHQFSSLTAIAGYKLDGNWSKLTAEELFATGTVVTPPVVTPPVDPPVDPKPEPEPEKLDQLLDELEALIKKYR